MTWEAVHLTQTIACAPADVGKFAGDPANLPQWASGLSGGIRFEQGSWISDSPMGQISVEFLGPVDAGVLDHDVRVIDSGEVFHNPLRVLRNDEASEVVFTLYRRDGMTDHQFETDAQMVRDDLARLRDKLEH